MAGLTLERRLTPAAERFLGYVRSYLWDDDESLTAPGKRDTQDEILEVLALGTNPLPRRNRSHARFLLMAMWPIDGLIRAYLTTPHNPASPEAELLGEELRWLARTGMPPGQLTWRGYVLGANLKAS